MKKNNSSRVIFHIDVNSAFLSWEAVKRVEKGERDIRGIPSIIGGDPEKRTSIVLAKSVPAKKYGIVTGEPVASALRKCPGLFVAASDFRLYYEKSRAFKKILAEYTPLMEEFSIDECFLDMTGMERLHPDIIELAYTIKDRIKRELGFTVNIGVSSNKLLAKMASDFEKPDRVHTLFPDEIEKKMWPLPVSELFLCGRSSTEKLKKAGVKTIGDLASSNPVYIKTVIGAKGGEKLFEYANGIDDSEVSDSYGKNKSYSNEVTFEEDIKSTERCRNVLLHLADSIGSRLRSDGVRAYCISFIARGNDMKKHSHQCNLPVATDITSEIFDAAEKLMMESWGGKVPLRLVGLSASKIEEKGEEQISFFSEKNREKERNADHAVDRIREKFGSDMIKSGGMLVSDVRIKPRRQKG